MPVSTEGCKRAYHEDKRKGAPGKGDNYTKGLKYSTLWYIQEQNYFRLTEQFHLMGKEATLKLKR